MTLAEFEQNGFVTGKLFEVEGIEFWVDKCRNGRYFNSLIGTKQVTRATADMINRLIKQEVKAKI